jgi:phosphoserine phosphatase (EC 3.1.3.3)
VELRFPDKGAAARSLKDELRPGFVVAVGDGWNDVPMLAEADLAIGFRPKPVLEGYVHMSASSIEELSRVLLSGRLEAAAERGEEGQRGRRASLLEDAPAGEGAHVGRQLGHDAEPGRVQAAAQHLPPRLTMTYPGSTGNSPLTMPPPMNAITCASSPSSTTFLVARCPTSLRKALVGFGPGPCP